MEIIVIIPRSKEEIPKGRGRERVDACRRSRDREREREWMFVVPAAAIMELINGTVSNEVEYICLLKKRKTGEACSRMRTATFNTASPRILFHVTSVLNNAPAPPFVLRLFFFFSALSA
jgi:hypothetical protein